jgi:phosphate starvation-inducible membrane PsiE
MFLFGSWFHIRFAYLIYLFFTQFAYLIVINLCSHENAYVMIPTQGILMFIVDLIDNCVVC